MEPSPPSTGPLARLHAVLDRLVRRLTGRMHGSAREMQMEAGSAITLLRDVNLANREYYASTLSRVIHELGQRRPDLFRYVVVLERALDEIEGRLGGPPP